MFVTRCSEARSVAFVPEWIAIQLYATFKATLLPFVTRIALGARDEILPL